MISEPIKASKSDCDFKLSRTMIHSGIVCEFVFEFIESIQIRKVSSILVNVLLVNPVDGCTNCNCIVNK